MFLEPSWHTILGDTLCWWEDGHHLIISLSLLLRSCWCLHLFLLNILLDFLFRQRVCVLRWGWWFGLFRDAAESSKAFMHRASQSDKVNTAFSPFLLNFFIFSSFNIILHRGVTMINPFLLWIFTFVLVREERRVVELLYFWNLCQICCSFDRRFRFWLLYDDSVPIVTFEEVVIHFVNRLWGSRCFQLECFPVISQLWRRWVLVRIHFLYLLLCQSWRSGRRDISRCFLTLCFCDIEDF